MASAPICIDISHSDEVHDAGEVLDAGISFVWHKCTEGFKFVDPLYRERRKEFADAGLKNWGAYHFFHGNDPRGEADHFLELAAPTDDTALALDWENLRDGSSATAKQAAAFIERILDQTKRPRMWVYGGNVLKENIAGHDLGARVYWENQLLWLCQYGLHFIPPLAWGRVPDLWQNNGDAQGPGPHRFPGLSNYIDNSCIVRGTVDDLAKKWAGADERTG